MHTLGVFLAVLGVFVLGAGSVMWLVMRLVPQAPEEAGGIRNVLLIGGVILLILGLVIRYFLHST